MNLLTEKDKPKIQGEIIVYAGRFQPFHKGHHDAYQRLVSEFGPANVYIATSNDTSSGKSPFSFNEKKEIATKMFGVPSTKFVKVSNPYRPAEILKKYDGQTIAYIAAVGDKDATRLQGKYFKPYKGKAGYGYDEIGYTYPIPAEANPISGTDVRKGLGSNDKEKAKKFFLKAYPKFDKDIFKMITTKLNEGFPGGIGVGLDLPGGYINGAPTGSVDETNNTKPSSKMRPEPHPTRHETEHPSDEPDWHKTNKPYDPIGELITRVVTEEAFGKFIAEYFGEAENKALDVDISYTDSKGQPKKIKARNALRLPKDHPAHIQAAKIAGPDDAPANEPKKKEEPGKTKVQADKPAQPGQPTKKDQTAQGKADKEKPEPGAGKPGEKADAPPPEQKLGGAELKSSAEMSPDEKSAAERDERLNRALDISKKEWSDEEKKDSDDANNPESPERKGVMDYIKQVGNHIGKSIKHVWEHNKEMISGVGSMIKSIATTGKIGSVKDGEGKNRHWSEFTSVGRGGGHEYEEIETDVLDSHGHPTGKKKTEKRPKISEQATDEEKQLFEASWKESKRQKKAGVNLAKFSAYVLGGVAATGAIIGAGGAAAAGGGIAAMAKGAAAKIGYKFGASHIGGYVMKDIIKHVGLESLGLSQNQAAGGGVALGVAGIFENTDKDNGFDKDKFIKNYTETILQKLETYKLSKEQMLKTIHKYNKDKPKNAAANLLKENISDSKKKSIEHFIEYATKRLKLKEQPKITLLTGREYSEAKTSLGGYNPMSKEIYVAIEGRLGADILRTIAHEMVHRKQDELGLVKDEIKDGATGSPIENQAHAVAGILMREYGRINKQIYNESISKAEKDFYNGHADDNIGKPAELDTYDFDDNRSKKPGYQLDIEDDETYGYEPVNEDINIDVDKGDEVLMGKFKNKKVVVKDIGKDDYGMPTINGKKAATFRLGDKGQNIFKKEVDEADRISKKPGQHTRSAGKPSVVGNMNAFGPSKVLGKGGKVLGFVPDTPNVIATLIQDYPNVQAIEFKSPFFFDFNSYKSIKKGDKAWKELMSRDVDNATKAALKKDFQLKESEVNESLLLEGGAYGHMAHPFDDMDLTFGDLKDIISKALNGDLGVVREKTDGQALAISWKNGRLIAARNKGNLANAGANAMGIEDVASKFGGRGGLTDAYNFAMKDLSAAIQSLSEAQRKKIFNEGKCFMNLEVIWPTSVNVIPYGQALLVFHNTVCYDEKGTATGADGGAAGTLAGMIKQVNADVQSKYTIQGPPITSIPKSDDLSSKQGKYLSRLKKLQSEFGLNDSDNVADYHQSWWDWWITSNAPIKVDKITKESLIRRWAFGDKGFRLNTISNLELQKWATTNDKVNVAKQQKDNIKPFEEIFLGVGADVLEFVGSVLTVHPEKAIRAMKQKFVSVASQVRNGGDPSKISKLKQELSRLNSLGGIDKIVASEGIVFFYGGKTYKLTGTFAPLNQILGIFYS